MTPAQVADAADAALECLLWAEADYLSAGDRFTTSDFPPAAIDRMHEAVTGFLGLLSPEVTAYVDEHVTAEQLGHDLVLTANGHGAGFWDRGYPGVIGDALSSAARTFGFDLFVGIDGWPDFS